MHTPRTATERAGRTVAALHDLVLQFPDPPSHTPQRKGRWHAHTEHAVTAATTARRGWEEPGHHSFSREVPTAPLESLDFDMLLDGVRDNLHPKRQLELMRELALLSAADVSECLSRAYDIALSDGASKKGSSSFLKRLGGKRTERRDRAGAESTVSTPDRMLSFGLGAEFCPLNETMCDQFTITNQTTGRFPFRVIHPGACNTYEVEVVPDEGMLKKKDSTVFKVYLRVWKTETIRETIVVFIEGVGNLFFTFTIRSEPTAFGLELTTYVEDGNVKIPAALEQLRKDLYRSKFTEKANMFTKPVDDYDHLKVLDQINRGSYETCSDPHVIASIIKHWYRALPVPLLDGVESHLVLDCHTEADARRLYDHIPRVPRIFLDWLLDILTDVIVHNPTAGAKPLATVVAPNLFSIHKLEHIEVDGQKMSVVDLSTHVVKVLQIIIELFARQKKERIDTEEPPT